MQVDPAQLGGWILGSLSSGIVAVDGDGAIAVLNPEARRILGCPGEHAAPHGSDCRRVLEAQPAVARLLIETLHGRDTLSRAELVLEPIEGRGADIIGFTLSPIRDEEGQLRGAFMLFRNLTPIERSDEQDRLRERLAALGQMAAGMAHEIRNPLAGMEVIAGLLKRRLGDRPDEQLLVEELTGELHEMADTVTASLEFVKPVSLERGPVDPVSLIEESLAIARSRVAFAGAIERCYDGRLPELWADADQLRTVLTNLVVNAFEAMAEDTGGRPPKLILGLQSHVADRVGRRVRVGRDGRTPDLEAGPSREVVISVSDTGPGVPQDLREKVFYPFFTTRQEGSGVGLATAQKIVASHGGVIELDEVAGGGSSFRVRLPDRGSEP
jgi:nitrogen-specific signal transduction histidine kinase